MKARSTIFFLFTLSYVLSACTTIQTATKSDYNYRFNTQYDPGKNVYRQSLSLTHSPSFQSDDAFTEANQQFIKTTSKDSTIQLYSFDIIKLQEQIPLELEAVAYFILDGKALEIQLSNIDYQQLPELKKDHNQIYQSDSTQVNVITDVRIDRKNQLSFNYLIEEAYLPDILAADHMMLRFYYGPYYIDYMYNAIALGRVKSLLRYSPLSEEAIN